jgi:transcriptional regulator with XRE-family HTH domain
MDGRIGLARYLKANGESQRAFERRLGLQSGMLSGYLSGKRRPGLDTAAAIERETGGAVPAVSWAENEPAPTRSRRRRLAPEPA